MKKIMRIGLSRAVLRLRLGKADGGGDGGEGGGNRRVGFGDWGGG